MSRKPKSLKRGPKASKRKPNSGTSEMVPPFTDLPVELHGWRLKLWRHFRAMVPCTEHECGGLRHEDQDAYNAWYEDLTQAVDCAVRAENVLPRVQAAARAVIRLHEDEPNSVDSSAWEQWSSDMFHAVRTFEDSLFMDCCICCLDTDSGVTNAAAA